MSEFPGDGERLAFALFTRVLSSSIVVPKSIRPNEHKERREKAENQNRNPFAFHIFGALRLTFTRRRH